MSTLGRALGGLLAGYGQGIATQAKFDMERQAKIEDDDALLRRSLALEGAKAESAQALESYKADRKDISTAREITLRAAADADKDERKFGYDVKLEKVKFNQELQKLGVQFSNSQKLEAFKTSQEIAKYNATTGAQNPIVRTIVSEDGQLYGVTKDGGTKPLAEGVKFPKAQGLDALLMGQLGGGGDEEGGEPAPAATPKGLPTPKRGKTVSPTELSNLYNQATAKKAAGDPRYKNLNASQIKAKVQDMLRAQGYTIPAGA